MQSRALQSVPSTQNCTKEKFNCIHYVCSCNFKLLKGKMLGHNHDNKLAGLVSVCSHMISCLTGKHNTHLRAIRTNLSQRLLKMVNSCLWWPLCCWQKSSPLITYVYIRSCGLLFIRDPHQHTMSVRKCHCVHDWCLFELATVHCTKCWLAPNKVAGV